ncbi:MAG: hypothetical protein P4L36_03960 [Holophaga sp.]|nr:hypothetical protein [Holophaga sp.]
MANRILALGFLAGPALWAGFGETVTIDARALKKLEPGWVIIREQGSEPRIYPPHWLTRRELTLRNLNGAAPGETEEITAASPIPDGWEVVGEQPDQGMDGMHFAMRYQIRKVRPD